MKALGESKVDSGVDVKSQSTEMKVKETDEKKFSSHRET